MSRRLTFSTAHALISLVLLLALAALVWFLWYPSPFRSMAGGLALMGILIGVDLVLGPLLTAIAADPRKPLPVLRKDLAVIATLQLAALCYGVYTIAVARPVLNVFEVDRFRLVSAVELQDARLDEASPDLRRLSWTGPRTIGVVKSEPGIGMLDSIDQALRGIDLALRPSRWTSFDVVRHAALEKARPIAKLLDAHPAARQAVVAAAKQAGMEPEQLRFLPLVARSEAGVALVHPSTGVVLAILDVDPFF